MEIMPLLLSELEQEAVTTRKMLKLVPDDKFDWKPHEKSMPMKQLAVHVAELPGWVHMALTTEELDFATFDYKPAPVNTTDDLLKVFDESLEKSKTALQKAKDDELLPKWTLRSGDKIHQVVTKYTMIRHALAQQIHHRAQLGVYLRLLNIPIPGSYGPSADEPMM